MSIALTKFIKNHKNKTMPTNKTVIMYGGRIVHPPYSEKQRLSAVVLIVAVLVVLIVLILIVIVAVLVIVLVVAVLVLIIVLIVLILVIIVLVEI